MAISANALTLAQWSIQANDPLVFRIGWSLLQNGKVFDDLPLVNRASMKAPGVRWDGNLPSVSWRKLNQTPTVTSGTATAFEEQAYIISNAIDTDRFLVKDENSIQNPRAVQLDAYLKSVSYELNDKFLNNSHPAGNVDAPVGIRARLDNPTTYGVASECKIDGGGVDMSQGGMTAATANTFIELVQTMLDFMGDSNGNGCTFYVNDYLKRRWERAIRLLGAGAGFTMTKDAYDRAVDTYKAAKVIDIGRTKDQSTRIITNTETSAGANGSSTYTSMYCVRYGDEYMMGWQFEPLVGMDVGLIGDGQGTMYRTLVDYAFGLFPQTNRCIARAFNIKIS